MNNFLQRTKLLIGEKAIKKLDNTRILLFGLGGVGGSVLEAIVRAGVGHIDIVDNDVIDTTNINRQILATSTNIGKQKTEVAFVRAKEINPNIDISIIDMFYLPENSHNIDFSKYDYVIDAIDTITAKIDIIKHCKDTKTPIISCMGTGNKLDATKFEITDIYRTKNCKLAKVMRKLCKDNSIDNLTVLYSTEQSKTIIIDDSKVKHSPASISYTPMIAGMLIAQYVILDLIKETQ